MFCDVALAGRIERAEARFITACSRAAQQRAGQPGFTIGMGGGVASFAEPGSPLNKVAGLGFAGLPDFDPVELAYADRRAPVQAEVATLADPALLETLAAR